MTGLEDGEVLADHRHIALVVVPERSAVLASPDSVGDDMPDEPALLNGCLRYSGNGVTILRHRGGISDHKDVGGLGDVHEGADERTPGAIRRSPKHFHHRRGADACSPKHG